MRQRLSFLLFTCSCAMLVAYLLVIFGFGHGVGIMLMTLWPLASDLTSLAVCAMGWFAIFCVWLAKQWTSAEEYVAAAIVQLICAIDLFCSVWLFLDYLADREGRARSFINPDMLVGWHSYFLWPVLVVILLGSLSLLLPYLPISRDVGSHSKSRK